MKYKGMAVIMETLYNKSFRKRLVLDLRVNNADSYKIMKKAKVTYRKIIEKLPDFEKEDMFKTNILNCAFLISVIKNLDEKPDVEELTVYYENAMTTWATKLFCKIGGKKKFSAKDVEKMKKTAKMRSADKNPYSWNMDFLPYSDNSGYEARFYKCGICVLMKEYGLYDLTPALCNLDYAMNRFGGKSEFIREYTLASGGPYCDCGYKKIKRTFP